MTACKQSPFYGNFPILYYVVVIVLSFITKKSKTLDKDRYLYARAKVGLNLHLEEQLDWANELNERTYILAACGVPQLLDDPALLPSRFDKNGLFIADSPAEYTELFEYILNHPDKAKQKTLLAQREVFEKHTWFHRAEKLVSDLSKNYFAESQQSLLQLRDKEKIDRTGGLIFSKDRAMQLQAALESFFLHCGGSGNVELAVLYKASSPLHQRQYDKLKKQFNTVSFIEQTNFRDQMLTFIRKFEYVLFGL